MKKTICYLLFATAFFACKEDEENLQYEFHYKNSTAYPAKIIVYGKGVSFTNNSSDTIMLTAHQDIPSVMSSTCVGDYCKGVDTEPFQGLADSARIVFGENKEVLFSPVSSNHMNILYRNSYSQKEEGGRLVLEYIVNDELYNQAQAIIK